MRKSILFVTVAFLAISSLTVFAQSGSQNGGDTVISGQGGANSQQCTDVTRRVDSVTERYTQSQEKYMNTFQNMFENMEQLAAKFKADGYDTEDFEAHLAEYNTMMQNTNTFWYSFRNGIDNSKKGVCGNSDVDSGQEFNSARTQLMSCKNEMLKMRTFAQETLRQDLMDLRDQVAE